VVQYGGFLRWGYLKKIIQIIETYGDDLGIPKKCWKTPKNKSIHQEIGDQDPTKTWLIFYFS
jgi:hypothetical protein